MKYGVFHINQALGVILCGDIVVEGKRYTKGHVLAPEDLVVLKKNELNFIFGVTFEEGDIEYKTAQKQIAAQICGTGIGYLSSKEGWCKICATTDGIFMADDARLDKFNSFNTHIVLNTIPPHSVVKKGDIVAELEVSSPLITETEINEMIFKLSGNTNLLSVVEVSEQKAVLVYPYFLDDENEHQHYTTALMKLVTDMDGLGLHFGTEKNSRYDVEVLADTLFEVCAQKADVIFIFQPTACVSGQGIITEAVRKTADDIVNEALPVIGASDLLIARKGKTTMIVLPYAYAETDDFAAEELIKQALFTEHLSSASFTHKRTGRLLARKNIEGKDEATLIQPNSQMRETKNASVGAVVLAAGQGRRAGLNKLMAEDSSGEPLFMKAVKAAVASEAKPVFVITGYRHEELEEYLEKLDVNVLYNPSFASGIKTSIDMGLKAVPSVCDGALLIPADMPYITATDLNRLIHKFDKEKDKQLCLVTHKGIKSNPVLWSKSLYAKADIVPENAAFRVIFAEHADYTQSLEIKDGKKLTDVNFPHDLQEYAKS